MRSAENHIFLPEIAPTSLLMTFDAKWNPMLLGKKGRLESILAPYFIKNGIEPPKLSMWFWLKQLFQ